MITNVFEKLYEEVKKGILSSEKREDSCKKGPYYAYTYALYIDQCPRDDTRETACKNPEYAYWYAVDVDKGFHEDTWEAAQNTEYEEKYKEFINSNMKEEII